MFWREWLTLHMGSSESRKRVVHRLGGSDPTQATIRLLATALRDRDPEIREDAANGLELLARHSHQWVRKLGGSIYPKPSDVMAVVHQDFQEAGAIEALRASLKDESWHVRREAAVTLRWVGGREAVAELIELLESDPDWHVREQSAGALGVIGDRRAVDPLVNALGSDREFPVRIYCARALGDLADPRSVTALGASLQDESQDVRKEARHALHCMGGQEAIGSASHS